MWEEKHTRWTSKFSTYSFRPKNGEIICGWWVSLRLWAAKLKTHFSPILFLSFSRKKGFWRHLENEETKIRFFWQKFHSFGWFLSSSRVARWNVSWLSRRRRRRRCCRRRRRRRCNVSWRSTVSAAMNEIWIRNSRRRVKQSQRSLKAWPIISAKFNRTFHWMPDALNFTYDKLLNIYVNDSVAQNHYFTITKGNYCSWKV